MRDETAVALASWVRGQGFTPDQSLLVLGIIAGVDELGADGFLALAVTDAQA